MDARSAADATAVATDGKAPDTKLPEPPPPLATPDAAPDTRRADTAPPPVTPPATGSTVPAKVMDLTHWKLQLPGPMDIKHPALDSYSSKYFFADPVAGTVIFSLNAAETGSTANSTYVRAELREQMVAGSDSTNWPITGTHILSARLRIKQSSVDPDKVTVLQIHGYPNSAPPLLRIATQNGSLLAILKTDNSGDGEVRPALTTNVGKDFFDVEIKVQNRKITVSYNGQPKLTRDLSFWTYTNYFKAGAYPQAYKGTVQLEYQKLTVTHGE